MNKQIDILKQILLISTGEYYEINLTKNIVPGYMYQMIDDRKYNINDFLKLPENARFTDVILRWSNRVPENERDQYLEFFSISNLIGKYEQGCDHVFFRYNTKTVLQTPMSAEQHVFMYKDDETGEIRAFTYLLDLTQKLFEEQYKKDIENKLAKSFADLETEKKYLDVLYRSYVLAYHLDVSKTNAEVLSLNKRSHVWTMPDMYLGAVFDYDAHLKIFADKFITSRKEVFLKMLDRNYIARRMKGTNRFSFRIECIPNIAGNRNYEIQVVCVNPHGFDGRVIIVSQEIDNTVFTEKMHKAELNTERAYLEVLTGDFVAVYHVNLKENISSLIKVDVNVDGYSSAKSSLRQKNDYLEKVNLYCEKFVVPEQRESFASFMHPDNIIGKLHTSPRFIYRYKTIQKNNMEKFFEVQVLPMNTDPDSGNILIAFRDIDDIVTAEISQRLELEKRLELEINQNEVLSALGSSFYTIFEIDLTADSYECLRIRDEVKHFYSDSQSASIQISRLCSNFISREYKAKMADFLDLNTLANRMENKDSIEAECMTDDGNWRRVRFIAKRRSSNGELSHVLYVTQLISDEKNREEQLISIAEEANAANDAKTEFVSRVAHDIRTPMNSLFGFLQIAEANITNTDKVKYSLQKIRAAGEFLKELVNDVLDISKMENGKLTLTLKEASITDIFSELPVSVSGAEFGKELDFNIDIHDIICDKVMCDSLRLKQVYSNILSNAIKYTPSGGKIDFEVYEEPSESCDRVCLIIKISDNGIGMSKEFMKKMFKKFERETDTRLNSVSGYGLGLVIVKQIVDIMNGSINVQSKLGEGTSFTVEVELERAVPTEKSKSQKNYKEKCIGMHLLVAEDNELNREVIKELLNMNDITCDITADGTECINLFKNSDIEKYDAVLMDIQMPNMNGIKAAKELRALDRADAKTVPIIAMTANALQSDIQNCIDAGMNKHLAKPIDVNKLMKELSKLKE